MANMLRCECHGVILRRCPKRGRAEVLHCTSCGRNWPHRAYHSDARCPSCNDGLVRRVIYPPLQRTDSADTAAGNADLLSSLDDQVPTEHSGKTDSRSDAGQRLDDSMRLSGPRG